MQQLLHRGAAVTQHRTDEVLDASWDDLKSFLVCAKHKSFRNAGEVLALTSTTLMRRIDRLEERIGCKLFLRDQSGLTLSEEGAAMIADVTEMERCAFNIFRRASQSSNDLAGTVRVAVTEGPGNFWILPRLIDFQNTYQSWKNPEVTRALGYGDAYGPRKIIRRLGRAPENVESATFHFCHVRNHRRPFFAERQATLIAQKQLAADPLLQPIDPSH